MLAKLSTSLDDGRQGPFVLAVGAGGGCLDIFSLVYLFSFLSPSLWETARYRLKHCLKGPLNPTQPTNQPKAALLFCLLQSFFFFFFFSFFLGSFYCFLCLLCLFVLYIF